MQDLLSAPHRRQFVTFAGGDEQILRDMISAYEEYPPLFQSFSEDVHSATVGQAIEAVEDWVRHRQLAAGRLKKMLQALHDHGKPINEHRQYSAHIIDVARTYNQSCKQQWIQDAEEAKPLVTYDKPEGSGGYDTARATELDTVSSELGATKDTVNTLTELNTALASELAATKDTVKTLTEQNTALASELTSTKDTLTRPGLRARGYEGYRQDSYRQCQ
ncbi:hypothetical protein FN846DRAFT_902324 [Sphaerosporella brunnea]|uniref:Uncharacterized protein n=1 Tax=Sphaerosporella brunnea TaxID=1250544 RepID=A0A5J5FA47_9PEZI|nr:hypothetical protein FN846DRAFT_902324 [Sphaerosporella brunnea]